MRQVLIDSILAISLLSADEALIKTDTGFMFPSVEIKTYYESSIKWGKSEDHNLSSPAMGIAVVVWSNTEKWKFSTITNEEGKFKVEVKPDSDFRIKASNGSTWSVYDGILKGI